MTQSRGPKQADGSNERGGKTGTIVVRRTIPATVDELFDAWLDPDSLSQWMHPGTSLASTARVDARVGGDFEVVMNYPNGQFRHYGTYRAIERNRKLVFTWFSDATNHVETLVTVEFHGAMSTTEIVLTHERMSDHETKSSHTNGWTQGLALLEELLFRNPTHPFEEKS